MYRVMLVDDEPTAVNLLKTIIEKKCSNYEVTAIASHGKEALELLEKQVPDLIITDIQMPVMNGLALLGAVKEKYPEVMSVIVSGYQEFQYAQEAIRQGASEYILKPIVPSELVVILDRIEETLKQKYYKGRNQLMHRMVNDLCVDEKQLRRYFQSEKYYGEIARLNGLPTRFAERASKEVFSDINEWMIVYGRDDHEALYLCPEEILFGNDYVKMIKRQIGKEQPEAAYVTSVIFQKPIEVSEIGKLVKELYRKLDSSIVLGKSQTIIIEEESQFKQEKSDQNFEYLQELEYLAKNQKYDRLKKEIEKLILKWGKEENPQMWLESRIRQICYMLQRYDIGNTDYREYEFLMDEAFSNAETIEQLANYVLDIIFKEEMDDGNMMKSSPEEYFQSIKDYIRKHMAEPLSMQMVSINMGISQSYLSRMFRKYEDTTFSTYLTMLRMEKAKKMLASGEKVYIKEVAEQLGYKDQFYFSRIFSSYTGMCPSEYLEKEQNHVI